jgi:hypothetical protein
VKIDISTGLFGRCDSTPDCSRNSSASRAPFVWLVDPGLVLVTVKAEFNAGTANKDTACW